jgi:hypothetical protein
MTGVTAMSDAVSWRETDVPEQVFGTVGIIDLFIIGRDPELAAWSWASKGSLATTAE